jgi:hypothetical protein
MRDLFTEKQLNRIYELLSNLNDCNIKVGSNCKVSAIAMYVDSRKNFVCTYVFQTLGSGDGMQTEIKYVLIDPNGQKKNMLDVYSSEADISNALETMKQIKL